MTSYKINEQVDFLAPGMMDAAADVFGILDDFMRKNSEFFSESGNAGELTSSFLLGTLGMALSTFFSRCDFKIGQEIGISNFFDTLKDMLLKDPNIFGKRGFH